MKDFKNPAIEACEVRMTNEIFESLKKLLQHKDPTCAIKNGENIQLAYEHPNKPYMTVWYWNKTLLIQTKTETNEDIWCKGSISQSTALMPMINMVYARFQTPTRQVYSAIMDNLNG